MATTELVTEQFQFLGIEVDEIILAKCVELCETYNIDAEAFVEQWMAFSLSHLNGAPPNLQNLEILERKEFSKHATEQLAAKPNRADSHINTTNKVIKIYGNETSNANQPETDVISKYVSSNHQIVKVEIESSNQNGIAPATYSPNVGHSAKYSSRTNAGSVVHSFGSDVLLEHLCRANSINSILNLNIAQVPNDDGDIYTKAMFGFELLHEKANIYDNHIQYLSQCILRKQGITETVSVRHKSQTEVVVVGRIECDADARLNPKSVVLQGSWQESLSQAVPVDIDNVSQYTLFPGQVVVMRGVNPRGDRFVAHEIYTDASLPLADHKADLMNMLTAPLHMIAVAGPYTPTDNMTYEPLKDLINYIAMNKPHIAILTGPFMDAEHTKVKDNTMAESYTALFEKLMDSLGELNNLSPMTKIIIVPSYKDAFHMNIFPTPPYTSRNKHPNIQFVSDPCTLNINGVLVGVTSNDILMHLSQEEISNGGGDKLSRWSRQLLLQQSYCPAAGATAVDAALWTAHAHLAATPHLLLLPTNFRYFVKEVDGCVVVNPERLTKGAGGGTFARILIDVTNVETVKEGIAAQIVRI